jgi:nucleoside-diphosphate-sugar epimerase
MKLLVTGAGGFLGQYVVASAIGRGHDVRAMLRPASKKNPEMWQNHPRMEVVRGDLRASQGISQMLEGVEGVIHLAASKAGDLYEQFGGTVIATENLISAMDKADVKRLVVTSSFSVYEYEKRWAWTLLNESSPLVDDLFMRDEYCQTKLVQEKMILDHAEKKNWRCVVLRPGVIFGKDNLWSARLGMQVNDGCWIRVGTFASLPLTYVENCAEAIVLAAEYDGPERRLLLNVVDNQTPSQRIYLRELQRQTSPRPHIIPIPWTIMRVLARLAWLSNRIFFRGRAKVPGLFVPSRLHARCKPLRYTNKKICSVLGWRPKFSWKEGISRSMNSERNLMP